MLAIAPHLVRRDLISQKINLDADTVRTVILDQAVTWPWTTNEKQIAEMGVIGDPKEASAEFGEHLLTQIANNAGSVFKQLLDRQRREHG